MCISITFPANKTSLRIYNFVEVTSLGKLRVRNMKMSSDLSDVSKNLIENMCIMISRIQCGSDITQLLKTSFQ